MNKYTNQSAIGAPDSHTNGAAPTDAPATWIMPVAQEKLLIQCLASGNDKAPGVFSLISSEQLSDGLARRFFKAANGLHTSGAAITPETLADACELLADADEGGEDFDAWSYAADVARGGELALPRNFGGQLPGATALKIAEKIAKEAKPQADEWGEALPLGNALLPVPQLSPALIPAPLRAWVYDCAERVCCAPDYIAVAALVAGASLVGNTICIRPKCHDDWLIVPNLWGALVGVPSAKKSPAVGEALKPLSRLKAQAIEKYRTEVKAYKAEALLDELGADALKSDLKKRQKSGATREELRAIIQDQSDADAAKPTLKTYSVQDPTIEALRGVLERNPRGFLIERDELSGWLRAFNRQGHEQDRPFYTEAFSGTATNHQIERAGQGTIIIPHFTLSLLGTIQPLPFAQLIRAATTGSDADGFVARFQMLVYPDALPYKHVDRWPDTEAKNRAFAIFEALDNLTPESIGAQCEEGERAFLQFSPEAQAIFDEWLIDLQNRLPSQSPLIHQHLAKYPSLMPSLALLFHLIAGADSSQGSAVSAQAAMMASEWCEYLEAHARRIYGMAGDGATDGAELIATRFGQLPNPFTAREVSRKCWTGLTDRADVESAIARLEDRGWIRPQSDNSDNGRPTVRFWKHPAKRGEK
jgi:putative DNA primase/helicase